MDEIARAHIEKVKSSVLQRYSVASVPKWVSEKTFLALQPFSFHDHEYQERILGDTSRDVAVRKCAQVGISEVSVRMALALVNVISPYTLAYTLPTATFASTFVKTRIDPIIQSSSELRRSIHRTNDNSEIKQFGDSFLFVRGAASSNAPISIPCDHLVHDEVDFSDQEVLSQYTSRLGHSKWKRTHRFSTPTLPNYGVDMAFQDSRRHFLMCKCNHCNEWFVPDYYKHVRIPGFVGDLREINKSRLSVLNWREAYLVCPQCGLQPSLQIENREWVCENPTQQFDAAGYQVSPFDAPNIIKIPELVVSSTKYERLQDFVNFALGLPAQDSEATLVKDDFAGVFVNMEPETGKTYVMGIDVGNVYHFVVAAVDAWGDMTAVLTEQVPMGQARKRYLELKKQFRVSTSVIDSQPHAETVMSLQEADPNLFASIYVKTKSIVTHVVVDKEERDDKGQQFQRQVNVNRNRAMDAYMNFIREGHLRIRDSNETDLIIAHHMSMKRVKTWDIESGELQYSWQKTDGVDHYHHAFVFAFIAARIRGVARSLIQMPVTSIHRFKVKERV